LGAVGLIPALFRSRYLEVNGDRLTRISTPNFRDFRETVIDAHTLFITKDLTAAKLQDIELDFGEKLRLKNGDFISNEGKRREDSIPLKNVRAVISKESVILEGDENEKGRAERLLSLLSTEVKNVHILHRIVEIANM
ncbi:MAG: hypothetical protein FWC95_08525, partial [Defluviitaleaceae bacterium]|nr:hypothetical protein [Defluviitaleaceae bacterium]